MPELSRSQLLVYGAIAVALLLVGVRWVRGSGEGGDAGVSFASAGAGTEAGAEAGGGNAGGERGFTVAGGGDVVVHVAGAVADPGVYRLPEGSRVTDAVERAGGAEPKAALDGINLAARLADGQQIVIPARTKSPVGVATGSAGGGTATADTEGPISLGTATVEQLDTIEGIGPVTAQEIVDFRDRRGGLGSIEELDEISGIGPATMEALRERLQP